MIITEKNGFTITTDKSSINLDRLHDFLANKSYWAQNIPKDIVKKSIDNSLNFSILNSNDQFVGFARLVTDYATFAYLADVYIEPEVRGIGLSKWLMETINNYPLVKELRSLVLFTKDAQELYRKFGWKELADPSRCMVIRRDPIELYGKK